jgi:hypothetical protein
MAQLRNALERHARAMPNLLPQVLFVGSFLLAGYALYDASRGDGMPAIGVVLGVVLLVAAVYFFAVMVAQARRERDSDQP